MKAQFLSLLALGLLVACGQQKTEPAAVKPPLSSETVSDPSLRRIEDCSAQFRFEPSATLSPDEYFLLLSPTPATDAAGEGRLTYRAFDYENTIERDGWTGLGVVIARTGPNAAKSIGGLLLVKSGASLLSGGGDRLKRSGDKLELTVAVDHVPTPEGPAKCAHPYLVTLDDKGVLVAGGKEVGRLR